MVDDRGREQGKAGCVQGTHFGFCNRPIAYRGIATRVCVCAGGGDLGRDKALPWTKSRQQAHSQPRRESARRALERSLPNLAANALRFPQHESTLSPEDEDRA